jgi:hypothetical protein
MKRHLGDFPGDHRAGIGRVRWFVPIWWVGTRRQWRSHGGAVMVALGLAFGLASLTRSAPAGGEPLYLSLLFVLGLALVVSAPLILTIETALSSRRVDLVPLTRLGRWGLRLVLASTLRSASAAVVLVWALTIVFVFGPAEPAALVRGIAAMGWVLAAMAFSLFLEDAIRHRRAIVLHQIVFLAGLSLWPAMLAFLRNPSNFVPPPAWSVGPAGAFFLTGDAPLASALGAAAMPFVLAMISYRLHRWILVRHATRAIAPPAGVGWTAAAAGILSGSRRRVSLLHKELLVPLRFLFLRMSIVFIVLAAVAAFGTGTPYLLLSAVLWWQPVSTNALGPDVDGGLLRYRLMGWTTPRILRYRLLATVILTAAAVAATGLIFLIIGAVPRPSIGPPSLAMYPLVLVYSLSAMALWAIAGDRYSRRFPDAIEMHTLLPERKRSAGAVAVIAILLIWILFVIAALAGLGLAFLLVRAFAPGTFDLSRLAALILVASTLNVTAYLAHSHMLDGRRVS